MESVNIINRDVQGGDAVPRDIRNITVSKDFHAVNFDAMSTTAQIKTPLAVAQGPCPFWGASELIHSLAS